MHDPGRLDAARGRDDHLRSGVVDPGRQLPGTESAEDDRVHGTQPGAGEHRDHGLGHHRHVDDDPVALRHAEPAQPAGEPGDLVAQLPVGIGTAGAGERAVVDQRRLLAPAGVDVPVHRVVAGVQLPVREPAVERLPVAVEDPRRRPRPVDGRGGRGPEAVRVGEALLVRVAVGAHPLILPRQPHQG
jgi:hypothetical protein